MYSCYARDYSVKGVNFKAKQEVDRTTRCGDIAIWNCSKMAAVAAAAILDLFEPNIAPLDPPSPKTPPQNKHEVNRTTGCGDTATLVQSACRLSVRLSVSVTLVDCDHIGWSSSKIISRLVSVGHSLSATSTRRVCSKGNTPKFGPKVTHPLLIWASETFDRKLRPNGYI